MHDNPHRALEALVRVPLAVAVIGAGSRDRRACSTGTLTYVSLDPPLLATPLVPSSQTCSLVLATGEFSVSVLADDQAEIAVRAGVSGTSSDKFAELRIPVLPAPTGRMAPAVAGSVSAMWCDLDATVPVGDHVVCMGLIASSQIFEGSPLVRVLRRYHTTGVPLDVPGEQPYPL